MWLFWSLNQGNTTGFLQNTKTDQHTKETYYSNYIAPPLPFYLLFVLSSRFLSAFLFSVAMRVLP
jgi:hypothetical protein